ncbi:MAG: amidohydrolase family protein, partial [Saprospiraceae bacterium]
KCLGVDVWGKSDEVIQLIERARSRGLRITADQYPYRASGTHLDQALLPGWVYADDPDFEKKFSDPVLKDSIGADMVNNLRRRGGPGSLLLTSAAMPDVAGKTLAEISGEWQMPPIEAAKKIIVNGSAEVASFNMQEEDIENFMRQDWVMTSSDGTVGHPRKFGTFPKKIREYVREKNILTLPEMVHKSTSLSAKVFGIPNRGLLKKGYYADVLIFKPEEVLDKATYERPDVYAAGMEYVIVNGRVVIDKHHFTGMLAGQAIRRRK